MTTDSYLIPQNVSISPGEYAAQAKKILLEMEVISGELIKFEDIDWWYQGGDRNSEPFGGDEAFEMCEIYGKEALELIPSGPAPEPKCPQCSHDTSEQYYDAVNDYEELDPKPGYETCRVLCPSCGKSSRLDELKSDPPIHLSRTFVSFTDTMESIVPTWLEEFNRRMEITHEVVEYSYT